VCPVYFRLWLWIMVSNATFNNISVIALWSVYFGSHGLYNVYVQSALAVMVFILCVSSHIDSHGVCTVCPVTLAVVVFIVCVQSHRQSWFLYCVCPVTLAVMVFILCVSSHIGSHGFYIVCVKSTLAVVVFINGLQSLTCC
jgi:F0F1-type ATP synthase membrane subunit a